MSAFLIKVLRAWRDKRKSQISFKSDYRLVAQKRAKLSLRERKLSSQWHFALFSNLRHFLNFSNTRSYIQITRKSEAIADQSLYSARFWFREIEVSLRLPRLKFWLRFQRNFQLWRSLSADLFGFNYVRERGSHPPRCNLRRCVTQLTKYPSHCGIACNKTINHIEEILSLPLSRINHASGSLAYIPSGPKHPVAAAWMNAVNNRGHDMPITNMN